jgi:hypothetical protein
MIKDLSFYQSTDVIFTPVDFNNPLHRALVQMIIEGKTPNKEANKIMKKAGFQSQIDGMRNTIIWSSDLFLHHKEQGHLWGLNTSEFKKEILDYIKTF